MADSDGGTTRSVTITAERLSGWLDRFAARHGEPKARLEDDGAAISLSAPDGATAQVSVPFPPLRHAHRNPVRSLLDHVALPRTVGVLLVRRGGYAIGVFRGRVLLASKVGSGYVQSRTKAGGWSQQRFARRRANQARAAYEQTADAAARILLPDLAQLRAVFVGGDRPGVDLVLADARLAPLRGLVADRVLTVPDPRQRVLEETPDQFLAVAIDLNDLA
jgi:hypothetical protein